MQLSANYNDLTSHDEFIARHIGPSAAEHQQMLASMGFSNMSDFIAAVVPASIRLDGELDLEDAKSEDEVLAELKALAKQNKVFRTHIGQGYYNSHTPKVVLRNILENPAWYTAYTPYQPEISQGRLEAILNYQTMVCDLTGMELANASMLDEGTAAAEAMALCKRSAKAKSDVFFVDHDCLPQTIDVVKTRAEHLDIEVVVGNPATDLPEAYFGVLLQYPGTSGEVTDHSDLIATAHSQKAMVVMAADILSLVVLKSPRSQGADVAVGNTQRFGVPMGFGGPHAAYMATNDKYKRAMPGRLVGVSIDSSGQPAYRLALQTREQHIRREKATSNICTAQVLLAVIASMYAVYHGPVGLRRIAQRVHRVTAVFAAGIKRLGFEVVNENAFDTISIHTSDRTDSILQAAQDAKINLRKADSNTLSLAFDETTTPAHIEELWVIFGGELSFADIDGSAENLIPQNLLREDEILSHPIFNTHHSETELLRYMRTLADKDIALDRAMIPLGSCTMKLNATTEMIPVTWPEFGQIHPFAPDDQTVGYRAMITELEEMLCETTGYDNISLQPNAGSQGEYAGLLAIKAYHESRNEGQRNIVLIPASAHGTNPASAQLAGLKVVVTKCDDNGNVDLSDLRAKAEEHSNNLSAIMVTYPSTHGVFEESIGEICELIHSHGGQVYIDGANVNAMVGLCSPGKFGGDVSHLNLHKTFCIPHGGGGPGVGPTAVKSHLAPFLPGHKLLDDSVVGPVSSAPYGSASILPISWSYIKLMGKKGLQQATENAILSANYLANELSSDFPVLYTGTNGRIAHECIIDLRPIEAATGISGEDVAKRLVDFGFHAPTMSFPVPGTLMIEPTESEPKVELDRFLAAMAQIKAEIDLVASGVYTLADNPLVNAPHTAAIVSGDEWNHNYTRATAAYPVTSLRANKYWAPVGRIDNVYGDRNLVCSCLPIEAYMEE